MGLFGSQKCLQDLILTNLIWQVEHWLSLISFYRRESWHDQGCLSQVVSQFFLKIVTMESREHHHKHLRMWHYWGGTEFWSDRFGLCLGAVSWKFTSFLRRPRQSFWAYESKFLYTNICSNQSHLDTYSELRNNDI